MQLVQLGEFTQSPHLQSFEHQDEFLDYAVLDEIGQVETGVGI